MKWIRYQHQDRDRFGLLQGDRVQHHPLAGLFGPPHELVSRLSQDLALEAGDPTCCGTSLGVLPMKPGTTIEVETDGIGSLLNTCGARDKPGG